MHKLTPQGQQVVNAIAARYGLSSHAVEQMLDAVANGGGTMAQFNIPELGGGGQWMQGGMTMVGDMFNHGLKATVDNLCAELSTLYFNQPFQPPATAATHTSAPYDAVSLFVPGSGQSNWWPQELGQPAASGAQNNMRYAYFPDSRRLAVDAGGMIGIYDTLDHQIGGFSQQQAYDGSITLTSQYGVVPLSSLPRADLAAPAAPTPPENPTPQAPVDAAVQHQPQHQPQLHPEPMAIPNTDGGDIFAKIEKLGELRDKGFVSEEQFEAKKAELLARL